MVMFRGNEKEEVVRCAICDEEVRPGLVGEDGVCADCEDDPAKTEVTFELSERQYKLLLDAVAEKTGRAAASAAHASDPRARQLRQRLASDYNELMEALIDIDFA